MKANIRVNWIGSSWGVAFASLWAILAGAALSCAQLIFAPVTRVDRLPSQPNIHLRYYTEGRTDNTGSWQRKIDTLLQGEGEREVSISEGEINEFLKANTRQPGVARPTQLNVKIHPDALQIAMISYPQIKKDPLILQVHGDMIMGENGYQYRARRGYYGCLPLPRVVAQLIVDAGINKLFDNPQASGYKKQWNSASSISLGRQSLNIAWN